MEYIPIIIMLGVVTFMVSYTYHRNKIGKPVESKYASRKFIVVVVALIYTILATFGLEVESEQVILVDTIAAVYATLQGLIDSKQAKPTTTNERGAQ